jgi:hypothetical protein
LIVPVCQLRHIPKQFECPQHSVFHARPSVQTEAIEGNAYESEERGMNDHAIILLIDLLLRLARTCLYLQALMDY